MRVQESLADYILRSAINSRHGRFRHLCIEKIGCNLVTGNERQKTSSLTCQSSHGRRSIQISAFI